MADLLALLAKPSYGRILRPRAFNFSGSQSFIDRLPTRRPFSITHGLLGRTRHTFAITNALSTLRRRRESLARVGAAPSNSVSTSNPSNISKFRLLGDARYFHPLGDIRPLVTTFRGSSAFIAPSQPEWERQADIIRRHSEKAKRSLVPGWSPFGKDRTSILSFSMPKRLKICLDRQVRREVMGALGFLGRSGMRPPMMRPMSMIRC